MFGPQVTKLQLFCIASQPGCVHDALAMLVPLLLLVQLRPPAAVQQLTYQPAS
jgi:hypothetical protein